MPQEKCKIHPENDIVESCTHCGRGVCKACSAELLGKTYCSECIKTVDAGAESGFSQAVWEKRAETGFFKALFATWLNILRHPKRFFQEMPVRGGIASPLIFGLVWGSAAIIAAALINMVLQVTGTAAPNLPDGAAVPSKAVMAATYMILIALAPAMVAAGLFLGAAVYHVSVLLFGGRQGFQATFRVISYSNAIAVFNLVPIIGPVFVMVYSVVLFIIGFKSAHKLSAVRAAPAAILPMLILLLAGFFAAYSMTTQTILQGIPR